MSASLSPVQGWKKKYDLYWDPIVNPMTMEFFMFKQKMGRHLDRMHGGISTEDHFKKIARALWPEDSPHIKFIWNAWSEWMLEEMCKNQYLAIAGCSGSGKSEICAIWAIINYLCDPMHTIVMVTSTTMGAARKRIWGKIIQYWNPLEKAGFPGKLVESVGMINFVNSKGEKQLGDMAGISLIASEKKKEKEAVGKLIGIHQERIIFIADELPELSEAITEAAFYNLKSGCQEFQFIGIGNPKTYSDAFGKFAKPKAGWTSIHVDSDQWETERGLCIHLDTIKNPRILGDDRCTWMHSQEDIDKEMGIQGAKTASFWRMYRGFWCPDGTEDTIYSDVEIINAQADEPAVWLNRDIIKLSSLDPGFTNGGDRSCATFLSFGINKDGLKTLQVDEHLLFHEDITDRTRTRSQQLVAWWKEQCAKRGVDPKYAGYDSTGGGAVLGDLIDMMWSKEALRVNFGGKASDLPVSAYEDMPSHERYCNRVTELWYGGKAYLRTGQIKGISPELMEEMVARRKEEEKVTHTRIRAESKKDMKVRIGKSPDISDSFFIACEVARQRIGFDSNPATRLQSNNKSSVKKFFQKYSNIINPGLGKAA